MIICSHVDKYFGQKTAVKDLSFAVSKGEILALLGSNGAGKSTTMKMLTGYLPASSGHITVCGFDIRHHANHVHNLLGYQPEGTPLYTEATVSEFLHFAARAHQIPARQHSRAVAYAISQCGLNSVKHQLIDTLSKGYRQRTCLAQSIIHDPLILVMDEPTDGLDPNQKQDVHLMIAEMAQEKTIVLSTHIMAEAEVMADRFLLLHQGQVRAQGTLHDLKQHLGDQTTVFVQLTADTISDVLTKLTALPSVSKINHSIMNNNTITLTVRESSDYKGKLLAELINTCNKHHWQIQEINKVEAGLKELFQAATRTSSQVPPL